MPFAIDDLASVVAHWSADQITGSPSDGDSVSSMPDSISDWHLVGTGTARPLYRPTAINSLPAVDYQGGDDWMVTASTKTLAFHGYSVSWVCNLDALGTYIHASLHDSPTAPVYNAINTSLFPYSYATGGGAIDVYGRNAANTETLRMYTGAIAALPASATKLVTLIMSKSGSTIKVDGAAYSIASGATLLSEGLKSAAYYFSYGNSTSTSAVDGKLAEIVFCEETLLCESLYIEGVLAHKYGITLPSSHPFHAAAPTAGPGSGGGGGLILPRSMHGGYSA